MTTQPSAQLDALAAVRAAVIGDIILDHYVFADATRISPEAPVPVVLQKSEEYRLGGAANVAANFKGLGCQVDLYGAVGADVWAPTFGSLLDQHGIGNKIVQDLERPTTVKSRIMGGWQQMLRLDREETFDLSRQVMDRLVEDFVHLADSYDVVVVSDYAKGCITAELLDRVAHIVGLGKVLVDPHPNNAKLYKSVGVVKPNKREAERVSGRTIGSTQQALEVAEVLRHQWNAEVVVITLGEGGLVVCGGSAGPRLHIPAKAERVFDVSGAGDCVAAVLGASLGAKLDWVSACKLANFAAGVVIGEVGTTAITREKMQSVSIQEGQSPNAKNVLDEVA